MTRRRLLIAGWLLVLALSASLPISAVFHGIVHIGVRPYSVRGTLDRPLVSIGSDVDLQRGSQSVVVSVFGNIRLHGTARDDLVALRGAIYLAPGSRVNGDVLPILGAVYRGPRVRVQGRLGGVLHAWSGREQVQRRNVGAALTTSMRLGLAAGLALLLVGTCLIVVFPWQVVLIATTLRDAPVKSVAAGIMNLLIFVFLVVPLSLSLAGLPFAVLLTGAASLAWLFGLTAFAVVVGRLLARGTVSLMWAAAAGLVVVAVAMAVPFLGPVAVTLVGLTGAGALAVAMLNRAYPAAPMR